MRRLNLNLCETWEIKAFSDFCKRVGIVLPENYEEVMEGSILETGSYVEECIDATIVFDDLGNVKVEPESDGDDHYVSIVSLEVFQFLYDELLKMGECNESCENLYTSIVKSKGYWCRPPIVQ